MYSPCSVSAACEVEGKIGELVHTHAILLTRVSFKNMPNELMGTPSSRGAYFDIQALTDFVMIEEVASLLVDPNKPCSCCFEETLLNSFDLLLFRQREQGRIKRAAHDRSNP